MGQLSERGALPRASRKRAGSGVVKHRSVIEDWKKASEIDSSLSSYRANWKDLALRRVSPVKFSWERLYSKMARQEPVVFQDFELPVRTSRGKTPAETILIETARGHKKWPPVRVSRGPGCEWKRATVIDLIQSWQRGRSIIGVTDLRIRGTPLKQRLKTSMIDDRNVLVSRTQAIAKQEMLTLVLSSVGHFSDSHSDAPDGWNHSFMGKKLWLVWDTFEGLARGLEDVERVDVFGKAAFSVESFLKVPSARWFLVEQGQTLFLPGRFTHKVITLERYLGIGSFVVMIPGFLGTLTRWTRYRPLWELGDAAGCRNKLVDQITIKVMERIRRSEKRRSADRDRSGVDHLKRALKRWERTAALEERQMLEADRTASSFLRLTRQL
jgi:hypothetical protein